jgi:hypothetical protein
MKTFLCAFRYAPDFCITMKAELLTGHNTNREELGDGSNMSSEIIAREGPSTITGGILTRMRACTAVVLRRLTTSDSSSDAGLASTKRFSADRRFACVNWHLEPLLT